MLTALPHRFFRVIVAAAALSGLIIPVQSADAAVYAGYSEYFIPGRTEQMWGVFSDLDSRIATNLGGATQLVASQGLHSVISITATGDNTTIYYDHWEDGYDFDPGDPDNTYDEKWVRNAGEVVTLTGNNIPVSPRGTAVHYDGGDRIYIAGTAVTISRTSWPESAGPVFAISWELFPVKPFLTDYTIPVGRDIAVNAPFYSDFQRVYILAQSVTDNNVVQIDDPTTPYIDVTTTLNRGETTELFNVNAGTHVKGQSPVQVQFIVGADTRDRYEARGFNCMPEALWDNEYFSPVGGAVNGNTDIYLYNPHTSAIIVQFEDTAGAGSFTIPARSTLSYQDGAGRYVPVNSGVSLSSDNIFWGISSVDTESRTYDWGFSLVPVNFLTNEYFLTWAPGTSDAIPTANGSPAFVTPVYNDTVIFVDYSPTDGIADLTVTRNRLETLKVFDPDNVNTGTHIYANGPIALAWGQDPDTAGTGNPYLDLGTANLPLPLQWIDLTLGMTKTADPEVLAPVAGRKTTFTVTVNTYDFPVADIAVNDTLPSGFSYVNNSTVITLPTGALIVGSVANPTISAQTLTWDNALLGNLDMAANQTLAITYEVVIDGTVGRGQYTNAAQASGTRLEGSQVFSPFDSAVVDVTPVTIDKDVDAAFKTVSAGDTTRYTIQIENISTTDATGVTVSDTLPTGFTLAGNTNFVESGATRTGMSNPGIGSQSLTWGTWTIAAGGSVLIEFDVDVAGTVLPDTYDNTASAAGTWGGTAFAIDDRGKVAQDLGTPSGMDPETDEDVEVVSLLIDMETSPTNTTAAAGGQVTYVITTRNDGASAVTGVDISASLPSGFTYDSTTGIAPTNATRTSTTNPTVGSSDPLWRRWTINAGGVVVITFVANVAGTTAPGTYDATAFAESTQTGLIDDAGAVAQDTHTPPGEDPEDDEDVTVQSAVLTIDKDAVVKYAVRGSTAVTWEIVVRNTGTSDATGVTITDTLPTGFTFNSNDGAPVTTLATRTSTSDPAGGATILSWGTWTIQSGGSVAVRFKADVAGSLSAGTYSNTAGTDSDQTVAIDDDGDVAQDTGTPALLDPVDDEDVIIFASAADNLAVAIAHTEDDNTYFIDYQVDVSNLGPSAEPGPISTTVTLPTGIDYISASGTGWSCSTPVGQNVTCTYGAVAAGVSAQTLTVHTEISATTPPAVNPIATATVSGTLTDYDLTNNTAADPLAPKISNLSTSTKTVFDLNGGDVEPGDILEYTITLTETGDKKARSVSVTDDIPANVGAFTVTAIPAGATDSSAATGGANGTGYLDINTFDIARLGQAVIKFRVTVNAAAPNGTAIDNTAVVTNPRGIGANAQAPTLVVRGSILPAQGSKPLYLYQNTLLSRTPPTAPQSAVEVTSGGNRTWTLSPVSQSALAIDATTGTIPVVLTVRNGYDGTWTGSTVHAVTVTLAYSGAATGTIGSLTQNLSLNNFSDTTTTFSVPITGNLSLPTGTALTVHVNQTNSEWGDALDLFPIASGGEISRAVYEATTVVNVDTVAFYDQDYPGGSAVATATPGAMLRIRAVVSDPFGSGDISGATVDIVDSLGAIRVNNAVMTQVADSGAATKTYEYTYTIPAAGPVDNWTATVTAAEGSEGTVTDKGVAVVEINPITGADLSITKSHTDEFYKNQNASFTLRVANLGPASQSAPVVVADTIPTGLTYVSSSGSGWTVDTSALPTVTWTYSAVPIAAGTTLPAITLNVAVSDTAPGTIANTATVALGSGPENNPTNNTSTDTVYVLVGAVVKTVNATSPYYDGDNGATNPLTYTITVTNTGTGVLSNVVVTDDLPAGTTYVSTPGTQVTAPVQVIRSTEYYIAPGSFGGTVYDLTLDNDLAKNYFVIVQGSDGGGGINGDRGPDEDFVALTADPLGTGDLGVSAGANVLRFARDNSQSDWVGVVTVVESLNDSAGDGFELLDVVNVAHSGTASSGTDSATIGWGADIGRTMLMGGYNGAGCFTADTDTRAHKTCQARIWPSGTNTINWTRDNSQNNLETATSTVMVVKWGTGWTVQRVHIANGNNGANGAAATGAYNTAALSTTVNRANTWIWGTGHTNNNGIGDSAEAVLLTLGNGVATNPTENQVAAGIEYANSAIDFEVYALTHPDLAVDHVFKADGDATALTSDVTVTAVQGDRMALAYNGQDTTADNYPRSMFSARYWDNSTIRLERRRSGTEFPAWVQGIDFSPLSGIMTRSGGAPPNLVTASDGYNLLPGETMTITFSVTVDDATIPQGINNTVLVTSDQSTSALTDSVDTVVRTLGVPNFTDASGNLVPGDSFTYSGSATVPAYLKVVDKDRNINTNAIDTVTVTVTNPLNGDVVTVTLYETGVNTGIFANNSSGQRFELPIIACDDAPTWSCLPSGGSSYPDPADVLYVAPGTTPTLQLYYEDPADASRDKSTTTAFVATLVVLSDVGVYDDDGRGVVYWETASEIGTAAFNILRRNPSTMDYEPVNAKPVPGLLGTPHGGIYRLIDPGVSAGEEVSYLIEEIEARGRVNRYGPYTVIVGRMPDKIAGLEAMNGDFARDPHGSNGLPAPAPRAMALFSRAMFTSVPAAGDAIKISIDTDGLYFISAGRIETLLGLDASTVADLLANGQLALSHAGRAVPYQRAADGSGLYFYAVARDSLYSGTNVYWLRPGPGQVTAGSGAVAGDVTGIDGVTLADAIVSLQVVSGVAAAVRGNYAASGADVNGNNRVDVAEALYVLQTLAEKRTAAGGEGTLGPAPAGQRFTTQMHMEQDLLALPDYFTDPQADYWIWSATQGTNNPIVLPISTLVGDSGIGPVTATVHLYGLTDEPTVALDHHVKVYAALDPYNLATYIEVGDGVWDGISAHSITTVDLRSLLSPPFYFVMIEVPDTGVSTPAFAIDAIDVTYERVYAAINERLAFTGGGNAVVTVEGFTGNDIRVFDVTDPHFPVRVNGTVIDGSAGNYRVTFEPDGPDTPYVAVLSEAAVEPNTAAVSDSDLRQSANAYDFLVIAPSEFMSEVQGLADYRSSQGLSGRAVSFEEIVDTFNYGLYSPEAIRSFLTYAHGRWQRAPRFVVLAGNGTYDYRNIEGKDDNKLPTMMVGTPSGLFASDQTLADMDSDGLPDLAIGRLPATSLAELGTMVDNVMAFESGSGPWRKKAILSAGVADTPGPANNFAADSDSVSELMPDGLTVEKVYKDEGQTHTDLVSAINSGAVLFNYLGHGGYDRLDNTPSLLEIGVDLPNLTNEFERPVMAALTCIVGNYGNPGVDALGERMIKQASGGAIAVWSPSGLSINENAVRLDQEYVRQLTVAAGERRLGTMIRTALRNYTARSGDTHLTAIYNLLGDPALIIPAFSD